MATSSAVHTGESSWNSTFCVRWCVRIPKDVCYVNLIIRGWTHSLCVDSMLAQRLESCRQACWANMSCLSLRYFHLFCLFVWFYNISTFNMKPDVFFHRVPVFVQRPHAALQRFQPSHTDVSQCGDASPVSSTWSHCIVAIDCCCWHLDTQQQPTQQVPSLLSRSELIGWISPGLTATANDVWRGADCWLERCVSLTDGCFTHTHAYIHNLHSLLCMKVSLKHLTLCLIHVCTHTHTL